MKKISIEEQGDDLVITFDDELVDELGWNDGDVLDWEVQDDGSITLTKYESERIHPLTEERAYKPHRSLNPLHDC